MSNAISPAAHTRARGLTIHAHPMSWATLVITTLAILMTAVDQGILERTMPHVKEEFHLANSHLGWINAVFFAGFIVGAYVFGVVSDRIGSGYRRTWTWNVAMLFAMVGGLLTWGFTGGFVALLLFRVPMGISRGGSEPVNVALVSEWWPKEHRGFALGVHHTGFPLGQFLIGPLMVAVLAVGGWRETYLVIPLLALVVIVAQSVVGTRRNQQRVFDYIESHHQTPPTPELSVRSTDRVLDQVLVAFRNPNVRWCMLLAFLFLWGEAGATSFLTVQLTERGIDPAQAVVIAGASGLVGWIGQIVWGTVSDHIGRTPVLKVLVIGWAVSIAAMYFIHDATTGWLILLGWGLFRNSPFPVIYAALVDSVPHTSASAMGVMIGTALGVSGIFAAIVAGYTIDAFGWGAHYALMTALVLAGLVPAFLIKETVARTRTHEPEEALR